MHRPQFSIRTLLWLTLVVAAFLGGIGFEKELERRRIAVFTAHPSMRIEYIYPDPEHRDPSAPGIRVD